MIVLKYTLLIFSLRHLFNFILNGENILLDSGSPYCPLIWISILLSYFGAFDPATTLCSLGRETAQQAFVLSQEYLNDFLIDMVGLHRHLVLSMYI